MHAVRVGEPLGADRAVSEVEAPREARVGEPRPVRVHVLSSEPRGTPHRRAAVRGRARDRARAARAPGPGAEAVAELRVTPARPGLAVWTARVDSLHRRRGAGQRRARRRAPGRARTARRADRERRAQLGPDVPAPRLARRFVARARSRACAIATAWRALESGRDAPTDGGGPARQGVRRARRRLRGRDRPGVRSRARRVRARWRRPAAAGRSRAGAPARDAAARSRASWRCRSRPAPSARHRRCPRPRRASCSRGTTIRRAASQAWRVAAPLASVQPLRAGGGDRVLLGSGGGGPPLLFSRRAGRGPVLLVNGTGFWRWSLSGTDALAADRGRRLWRRIARWLAEPVQGEPLRVVPERWLTPAGEPVRLFATLQDDTFRPVAGAHVGGRGDRRPRTAHALALRARASAGSYVATLPAPAAGRWQVSAARAPWRAATWRARAASSRWTLEPGAAARRARQRDAGRGRERERRARDGRGATPGTGRTRSRRVRWRGAAPASARLWESPWVFALVVAVLAAEWIWRRRRGLP